MKFWQNISNKKLVAVLFMIVSLAAISVPLILTNPTKQEYEEQIPADYQEGAQKLSVVYKDYKVMSCYIATRKVGSNAERISYLGIAGQMLDADSGVASFTANCMIWFPSLLKGAGITVSLTVLSVAAGLFLSIFLALGKISKLKLINPICRAYIFFFRGTPLLMQLYFIYFALPLINPALAINNRFAAAWIAFGLNSGAYCAEIIRAGIQSIDKGQFEASKALGMNYRQTMTKVIIPQTYRRLIPPVANEFIMVLKDASLTSIIALQDLTKITTSITSSSGTALVFIPSMAIYLVITAVFSKMFGNLEEKFSVYE